MTTVVDLAIHKHLVKVKKSTGDTIKAPCPFHTEDKPSFYMNTVYGFFHCFGCGAHGNFAEFLRLLGYASPTIRTSVSQIPRVQFKRVAKEKNILLPEALLGVFDRCQNCY